MKFLHTSDLHLGRQLNEIKLLNDQKYILAQIVKIAGSEGVDAVLIAGDVYQKASPQADAMAAFDDFVTQLTTKGIKMYIISGNHDSAQRISYFSALLKKSGVYMSENFDGSLQRITVRDEYGEIDIWMLPFLRPVYVRRAYPEEKIESYQDAVQVVLKNAAIDTEKRNVLLCHQFITGAETSDSEEKSVGGLDNIDAGVFDAFDYVALGHIHKPQRVMRDTLRYAGSIMKYSLSEVEHHKSVTIVEMCRKGDIELHTVPLEPLHEMRRVEGLFEDVMNLEHSEDYVSITLHDETPPVDAQQRLGIVFPNRIKYEVVNSKTRTDRDVLAREEMKNKTTIDLFKDFFAKSNNDVPPNEWQLNLLKQILEEMEESAE